MTSLSHWSSWTLLLCLSAVAPATLGCADMCLLKVCQGNRCSCSISTCPSGASFNTNRNACMCDVGRIPLGGSCMTLAEAHQYCGKGYHFERVGCVRNTCPPGQELDQESGACLLKQQVDQVAQNMGVQVGQGQKLGCPAGQILVMEGPNAASCVPPSTTCSRDEVWNGQACAKTPQCAPGSIFDAARNACVAYTSGDSKDEASVDLQQWTTASFGPNAGSGTAGFCGGFNKRPLAFGVTPGGSIRVRTTVSVQVPGGQVSQAQVMTTGIVEAANAPVTAKGAAEIQRTAQEILASLLKQGGKANVPNATTNVSCLIVNAAAPAAVPATGGL